MIHTVIFDIGGTILGAPDLFKELSSLFIEPDAAYDPLISVLMAEYTAIRNGQSGFITMEEMIRKTLYTVSHMLNHPDVSSKAKEVYYRTFVTKSYLYDDTLRILNYLQQHHIQMIVASDGDAELLYDEFKMHGIGGYFSKIFISSEVKAYKPSDQFAHALRQAINEPLDQVLFVGDSDCDIQTGQKLCVRTVFKGSMPGKGCLPDDRITDLEELVKMIEAV